MPLLIHIIYTSPFGSWSHFHPNYFSPLITPPRISPRVTQPRLVPSLRSTGGSKYLLLQAEIRPAAARSWCLGSLRAAQASPGGLGDLAGELQAGLSAVCSADLLLPNFQLARLHPACLLVPLPSPLPTSPRGHAHLLRPYTVSTLGWFLLCSGGLAFCSTVTVPGSALVICFALSRLLILPKDFVILPRLFP